MADISRPFSTLLLNPLMPSHTETIATDRTGVSREWILVVVHSPTPGLERKTFTISANRIALNRAPSDDADALVLSDPAVSQNRCALERLADGEGYAIVDNKSRNTPRINGTRVVEPVAVEPNDVIRVGDTLLVVERSDLARKGQRERSELSKRLCMFESTAAAILDMELSFVDDEANCLAIHAGFTEARIAADWASEMWNVDMVRVDADMDHAIKTIEDSDPDVLVVVERLDMLDAPGIAANVAEAIDYRVNGPNPRRTAFSYVSAPPQSQLARLLETSMDAALTIPNPAERRADILPALRHLIAEFDYDKPFSFPPVCAEKLLCYAWPSGLAELRRIARRLYANLLENGQITRHGLTAEIRAVDLATDHAVTRKLTPESFEAAYREFGGNMVDIAEHFSYNRAYFYRLLRKLDIDLQDYRN